MDPLSGLIVALWFAVGVGLLSGTVLGLLLAYVIIPAILWTILFVAVIIGLIGDLLHERKVAAGKAEFRLPFPYRLRGWRLGHVPPGDNTMQRGMLYDFKRNRAIGIFRPANY